MDVGGADPIEDHRRLAERVADLAIAHHPQLASAAAEPRRVGEEHEVVAGEVGVDRDPEQPAFADRGDVAEGEGRRRQHLAVLEDADPAGPLGEEHPAVGREGHRPRNLEVLTDDVDGEPRAIGRRHHFARRRRRRIGRGGSSQAAPAASTMPASVIP